ncbi:MAG: phosphatase PAP2 family protein [Planctomycetota bacterium]|nr:phosphatase PAP2 family protein [Planctomycetota bacterium]
MLPRIHDGNKLRALSIGYVIFCIFYVGAQFNLFQDPVRPPKIALDDELPFVPWSVWLYNSQFLFMGASLWFTRDSRRLDRVCYSILLSTVLAFIIFSVYPTEMARQEVLGDGPTAWLWRSLYSIDKPSNCFPSLHCCLALLGAFAISSRGWSFRVGAGLWAGAIAFSTLVTKQHVTLDVVAGLSLGAVSYVLVGFIRVYVTETGRETSVDNG